MTYQMSQIRKSLNRKIQLQVLTRMHQQKESTELGAVRMTEQHVEEIKQLLAAGFLQKNEIWSTFDIKREEILEFFDGVVRSHLEAEKRSIQQLNRNVILNSVFLKNGRIFACKLHYELEDYLNLQKNEKPGKLTVFKQIEKAGKELTKDLKFDHYPKGKTAFIDFGGYHPQYDPSNFLKAIMVMEMNMRLKQSGFDWIVGRLSNAKAMGLYKKFGAKTLSEVTFENQGQKFKLFFFEMDYNGETFCGWESKLQKMMEMEKDKMKQSKL